MANTTAAGSGNRRALCCAAMFAAAFWLGTRGIAWLAERAERASAHCADDIVDKRRWFAEHKDEYDAVFIGTSRVYRHINPAVFDAVLSRSDAPFHSFNFGVPQMNWIEALQVMEFMQSLHPARLRYVFLEPLMDVRLRTDNLESSRNLRANDLEYTWRAVRALARSPLRNSERWQQIRMRALSFANRFVNLGSLSRLQQLWLDDRLQCAAWRPDEPGFLPLDADLHDSVLARRAAHLEALDDYRASVEQTRTRKSHGDDRPSGRNERLHALARELASAAASGGAQPVFVIGATLISGSRGLGRALAADPAHYPVLSFADPGSYPELFTPDLRWDSEHHNLVGANEFSRQLAERFRREVTEADHTERAPPPVTSAGAASR